MCGLKLKNDHNGARVRDVTPCVGVWIETYYPLIVAYYTGVTPCVGVWIETYDYYFAYEFQQSHPAWVCGLKHVQRDSRK